MPQKSVPFDKAFIIFLQWSEVKWRVCDNDTVLYIKAWEVHDWLCDFFRNHLSLHCFLDLILNLNHHKKGSHWWGYSFKLLWFVAYTDCVPVFENLSPEGGINQQCQGLPSAEAVIRVCVYLPYHISDCNELCRKGVLICL